MQIYCDFSGYTDIAIGLALLLGFRFPQNFDAPYTADVHLQDFWRRWHMTLSRWLRDYLYIPLGGNRARHHRHLPQPDADDAPRRALARRGLDVRRSGAACTGCCSASSTGGTTAARRRGLPARERTMTHLIVTRFLTFNAVAALWVVFRAGSVDTAREMFDRLLTGWGDGSNDLITLGVVLATVAGIGCQYIPSGLVERLRDAFGRLTPVRMGLVMACGLIVIDALGPEGVRPFIYFAF